MESSSETVVHSSASDRVLVIMAKAPRPGAVKTRLVPSLSPKAVIAFYCCLLDDTLALARSLGDVEVAIMCPDSDVDELAQLAGSEASVVAQKGDGLAAGLTSVFAHFTEGLNRAQRHQTPVRSEGLNRAQRHQTPVRSEGLNRAQRHQTPVRSEGLNRAQRHETPVRSDRRRRIIAFNSDSPHLPRSILEDAFETLAAHDVVVGPTHDGGYYLVGAKTSYPRLFAGDEMGTSSALDRLLSRVRALELSVGFVAPFYDIDVADDLTRLAAELRLAPQRAPRTAMWLKDRKGHA